MESERARVGLIVQLRSTLDWFIRPIKNLSQSGSRSSHLVRSRIALFCGSVQVSPVGSVQVSPVL